MSIMLLNKIYMTYTGERRRWFTQATGQLVPLRFAPWWTRSFFFLHFTLVNSTFMPFRTATLVTSLPDKFAPLLKIGVIESKQSIIN